MTLSDRIKRLEVKASGIAPLRSALEGEPFTFPEPTLAQLIDWIDGERIPEYLEAANGGYARNERGYYPSKEAVEKHVAWCHETLAWLESVYLAGEIDADTYSRLITKQDYSREHLYELERCAAYFRPTWIINMPPRTDGREVSVWSLRTGPEDSIGIYLIGDQWVTFPEGFKPYNEPGW